MGKRVRVALHGTSNNRGVLIDSGATEGSVVGRDLRWPDGTFVQPAQIINTQTTITAPPPSAIQPTLWGLILDIPAKIINFLALAGTGLIHQVDDVLTLIDPATLATDWPVHKDFIGPAESLTIEIDFQYIIYHSFDVQGDLVVDGELLVEGDAAPEPYDPDFTYISGDLTQIDYSAGEQKVFTYNGGGDLIQVDFIRDGVTFRKDFTYTGGGDLDYITETYLDV